MERPPLSYERRELKKLVPLAISRGTVACSEALFVTIGSGETAGIGELSPATASPVTAEVGEAALRTFFDAYEGAFSPHEVWAAARAAGVPPPAIAASDIALWDRLAKSAGLPLFRLQGLPCQSVATSVTVGLMPPEETRRRVPELLERTGAKGLKVKLGSPAGRDHDRDHFAAAAEAAAPFGAALRVDANGGWEPEEAIAMDPFLAGFGVEMVEQPLAEGREAELLAVLARRTLPIFLDESCRFAADVPRLAALGLESGRDGVNLKLMKCGGITEALRIVAVARAHRLRTMIGCMSESSVGIAAAASLASLFDFVDLDSHLNLDPDPAEEAPISDGIVLPLPRHGHGARLLQIGA